VAFEQEDVFTPVVSCQTHPSWVLLTRKYRKDLAEFRNSRDSVAAPESAWNSDLQVLGCKKFRSDVPELIELNILVFRLNPLEHVEVYIPSLVHVGWVLRLLENLGPKLRFLKVAGKTLVEINFIHRLRRLLHLFM
jgi:hypothetical protein